MLALKQHNASLSNLNIRIERHGDERQLAADLKISLSVPGVTLNDIESGLHASMFSAPGSGDQPDLLDPNSLTAVKFPQMEPVRLKHAFPGYEVEIGDGDNEPTFLADAELKKITFRPKEGGSVDLSFTISAEIESDDVAELSALLVREDVVLSITPPKRQAQSEDLSDGGTGEAANDSDGASAAA